MGMFVEVDQKAFIISSLLTLEVFIAVLYLPLAEYFYYRSGCYYSYQNNSQCCNIYWHVTAPYVSVFSVVVLLVATTGLNGLARLPVAGPWLASLLGPGCVGFCCRKSRRGTH